MPLKQRILAGGMLFLASIAFFFGWYSNHKMSDCLVIESAPMLRTDYYPFNVTSFCHQTGIALEISNSSIFSNQEISEVAELIIERINNNSLSWISKVKYDEDKAITVIQSQFAYQKIFLEDSRCIMVLFSDNYYFKDYELFGITVSRKEASPNCLWVFVRKDVYSLWEYQDSGF
jgi:hypothetical protein